MREIKFRGQKIDNKEWVFGYLFIPQKVRSAYIITETADGMKFTGEPSWFAVNPKTVGQYIESKDIEGNEIYEGDKIRWYPNKPKNHIDNIVEYIGNKFSLGDWYEDDYPNTEGQCKIIGNIFDNPELRGGKS